MLAFTIPAHDWRITLPPPALHASALDVDKLCRGIALAETGGCKTGMAVTKNNCHGILAQGRGRWFASHDESQAACVDLWSRKYKVFPTLDLATRYTGGDRARGWLDIVTAFYQS